MTYIADIPQQVTAFLHAVGFGFLIGLLYDVFRAVRHAVSDGKKAFFISDVLFAFSAAFLTFLFALTVHGGSVRGYVLLGELLGFLVYYFTVGVLVMRLFDKIIAAVRRFFRVILRFFLAPLKRFAVFCKRFFAKNVQKAQKKSKTSVKKSKMYLQSVRHLLYNQNDKVSSAGEVHAQTESDGKKHMAKRKRKKQKHSFILSLALLLAVGYFVISFVSTQLDIREKEKEAAALQEQYAQQVAENERLQAVVDGGDESEYIERVAREKLGYVMPDEKVYYDITPSN